MIKPASKRHVNKGKRIAYQFFSLRALPPPAAGVVRSFWAGESNSDWFIPFASYGGFEHPIDIELNRRTASKGRIRLFMARSFYSCFLLT